MLCIACHYMKRGDSAFFTDPDNMNFRMMMYFFWGSVAYAFWNFSIWQKKMQRRDNEKYTKQTICVIAFLVSEIIVNNGGRATAARDFSPPRTGKVPILAAAEPSL